MNVADITLTKITSFGKCFFRSYWININTFLLRSTSLHCTELYCIALLTALHSTALLSALHCIAQCTAPHCSVHCTVLHCSVHCTSQCIALRCISQCIALHCITHGTVCIDHCTSLFIGLHYVALHCIAFYCIARYCVFLYCNASHCGACALQGNVVLALRDVVQTNLVLALHCG